MVDYIQLTNVSKTFHKTTVLQPLSISFEQGSIHGIIGRNGSGKTVLMKLILGLLLPTTGEIVVGGKKIGKDTDFPDDTGAVIETLEFIPYLSAYDNLSQLASIRRKISKADVSEILERVGLGNTGRKRVGKFSMGMRQRLAIAQAIMEHPKLIILDEPMNGLDKTGVEEMRILFRLLADEGATILIASHNPQDIDCLCQHVYEIDAGIIEKVF